jgi:L-iditol 2-dehydrogenase
LKACVYREPFKVSFEEIPHPKISENEAMVKVIMAGICGSDLEIYRGKRSVKPPLVLGHEAVGVITDIGENVSGFNVGDTVVIEPNIYCGECYYCRKGRMNICERKIIYGVTRNGVFAEYVEVPSKFLWRIPENMSYEAAVLVEPLSVVLQAIRHLNILPSDNVLVLGGGSIGAMTALTLEYMNINVVITEIVSSRVKILKEIGIRKVVNTQDPSADEVIKNYFDGDKADYVIDTVGTSGTFAQLFKWVKPSGKAIVLGLTGHKAEVEVFPLVRGKLSIEGSIIYVGDYYDSIRLMRRRDFADKIVKVITHRFRLEECAKAFEVADKGEGLKVVFQMQ